MKSYRVKWEIDVVAESPREAAEEALKVQRDKDSIATVFYVHTPGVSGVVVDLEVPERLYNKELWEKEGVLKEHKKR